MTPKEKATELANKFVRKSVFDMNDSELKEERLQAKKSALICADECIKLANLMDGGFSFEKEIEFWKQVKVEINAL
jgi:hypothetical protein